MRPHPPLWLCIVGPLATALVVFAARVALSPDAFERWIMGEQGLVELATVVVLLPGLVLGALAQRHAWGLRRWWLVALTLGCLYFAGEEISWGQHLFGWSTPQTLERLNDQQETNLHNMSSWLDQKPRLLLELWVLGLAVVGLAPKLAGRWPRGAFLWADHRLAAPAVIALLVRLPERIASWFDLALPYLLGFRLAELQELQFAWVLTLFLWAAFRGERAGDPATPDPP